MWHWCGYEWPVACRPVCGGSIVACMCVDLSVSVCVEYKESDSDNGCATGTQKGGKTLESNTEYGVCKCRDLAGMSLTVNGVCMCNVERRMNHLPSLSPLDSRGRRPEPECLKAARVVHESRHGHINHRS